MFNQPCSAAASSTIIFELLPRWLACTGNMCNVNCGVSQHSSIAHLEEGQWLLFGDWLKVHCVLPRPACHRIHQTAAAAVIELSSGLLPISHVQYNKISANCGVITCDDFIIEWLVIFILNHHQRRWIVFMNENLVYDIEWAGESSIVIYGHAIQQQ